MTDLWWKKLTSGWIHAREKSSVVPEFSIHNTNTCARKLIHTNTRKNAISMHSPSPSLPFGFFSRALWWDFNKNQHTREKKFVVCEKFECFSLLNCGACHFFVEKCNHQVEKHNDGKCIIFLTPLNKNGCHENYPQIE